MVGQIVKGQRASAARHSWHQRRRLRHGPGGRVWRAHLGAPARPSVLRVHGGWCHGSLGRRQCAVRHAIRSVTLCFSLLLLGTSRADQVRRIPVHRQRRQLTFELVIRVLRIELKRRIVRVVVLPVVRVWMRETKADVVVVVRQMLLGQAHAHLP